MTVIISPVWVLYNMTILGGAVAVAVEAKQVRQAHRVEIAMPAAIARADGHLYPCTLRDYSDGGVGIEMRVENALKDGDKASLLLARPAGVQLPLRGDARLRQQGGGAPDRPLHP